MKNIAITILSLALSLLATGLNGQDKKENVKVVVIEKTVDKNGNTQEVKVIKEGDEAKEYINEMKKSEGKHIWISKDGQQVDLDGKEYKVIKKKKVKMIQKDDDGNEEVLEWSGEGEMPDEIRKKLRDHDIEILTDEHIDIDIDENIQKKKRVKMIQKDDNGEQKVIEWEGEGEMPDDIKKVLEEHDIDIDVEIEGAQEKEMTVTIDRTVDFNTKIRIMKSHDDNEKEIDIIMEGEELSDDMKKILEENGIDLKILESGDGQDMKVMVITDNESDVEMNNNKAQLGVFIESEGEGVRVMDIVEGSAAEEAGLQVDDVIVSINDTKMNSMEELVNKMGEFNPGDSINVVYIRDSKIENIEVSLKAATTGNKKVMKKVEKYIFKEK